jgi:PUA domain protein
LNSYKDSRPDSRAKTLELIEACENRVPLRVYNLSKKVAEDFMINIWRYSSSAEKDQPPKVKDLKIAELDDPNLAIVFNMQLNLYFGRRNNDIYFPLLKDQLILPSLPSATVDMGAIKFVCNGANVMRPGILSFSGNFKEGSLLSVKEVSHSKVIAVGRAFQDQVTTQTMTRGPTIENLHYVGDRFWEALKLLED